MPFLILLNADGTTSNTTVQDVITLGARKDNDLCIPLKGISRRHARVEKSGDKYFVEDLNSTNFVFVNEEQVTRQELKDGDILSLGDYAYLLYLEELDMLKVEDWVRRQNDPESSKNPLDETTRIYHKDLPKTVRELEALIEVGAQLSQISDTDSVLSDTLEKVLQLMQADRGFIMLLDEHGELRPEIAKNIDVNDAEFLNGEGQYSKTFTQKVIEQRETLVSTNVAEDPRFQSESIISQRILSIMCAPLLCADKLLGCLYVDARESVRYYSKEDTAFLTALANQAAIAIDNARLTNDLRANQEFLESTNQQLQKSLQNLLEANRKLDRKFGEITALYEAAKSLNQATDVGSVLQHILEQSREVVGCERTSLMMYEPKLAGYVTRLVKGTEGPARAMVSLKTGEGIAGTAVSQKRGVIANQGHRDPRFLIKTERDKLVRNIMCLPLISGAGERTYGVINLVNSKHEDGFREEDLEIVSSLANLASVSIDKFNGLKAMVEREKHNQEIEDAHKVQSLLLPREMPKHPHFEFSAKYTLANRVGGDYYDFLPLEDGRIAVVIADVSGHDIASALVMAMGRNLIRTLFSQTQRPSELLARTSESLRKDTHSARYITMFLAILDPNTMTLTYANAGHNYPLFLTEQSETFQSLETTGFPLGLVDDFEYEERVLPLSPGDLLILYTDGVIEAQAPNGEMFTLPRLEKSILNTRSGSCQAMADQVYRNVTDFIGTGRLEDDLTFVSMRVMDPSRAVQSPPNESADPLRETG